RKKSSARRAIERARQAGNASFAAWTARSISSTEAKSTVPVWTPEAGLKTTPLRPDSPLRLAPPIQWLIGFAAAGASTTSAIRGGVACRGGAAVARACRGAGSLAAARADARRRLRRLLLPRHLRALGLGAPDPARARGRGARRRGGPCAAAGAWAR